MSVKQKQSIMLIKMTYFIGIPVAESKIWRGFVYTLFKFLRTNPTF